MTTTAPVIQTETKRHTDFYETLTVTRTEQERKLQVYDTEFKRLEQLRREEHNFNKKEEITMEISQLDMTNPRKWIEPFTQDESPYFGIVGIHDNDPKIGIKEYVFGKQGLIGTDNKVHVIDWRNPVSVFYYDKYEDGEEYEVEIELKDRTIERTGKSTHRRVITINKKQLHGIDTPKESYKYVDQTWITKDGIAILNPVSSELKTDTGNHELIDIVALISAEQFKSITKNHSGCTMLTGGAGCGKTTIAIHRLSYLQFNEQKYFNPDKCLVLVFNRALKDYVKSTSKELLGETAVDTFTSWGIAALKSLGCNNLNFSNDQNGYDEIKKHSAIEWLLGMYVANDKKTSTTPYEDAMNFYLSDHCLTYFFKDDADSNKMIKFVQHHSKKDNKLAYADVGVLLRLCQLRNKSEEVIGAVNHYDHIIADEAQDFAQHELEAIFASLNKRKSLTICADEKQKILGFVDATGLSNFKTELNSIGLDKTTFTVGYRSAPEIMDIANVVTGRQDKRKLKPNDNIVSINKVTSKDTALIAVRKAVKTYHEQDPSCLTAIICKNKADIAFIHKGLIHESISSVIHPAGTLVFTPGVIVINAHQVKGLEFTNVILWNPSKNTYRNNEEDKNLLYVAISRACKKLSIIHWDYLSNWFKI